MNAPKKLTDKFFTHTELKKRGWTDGLIKRLLGEPDILKKNPVFRSKAPMKLYDSERVEPLEKTDEFQDLLEDAERRQEGAWRARQTKLAKVQADLARITIRVPRLRRDRLISEACDHYNERAADRGKFNARCK